MKSMVLAVALFFAAVGVAAAQTQLGTSTKAQSSTTGAITQAASVPGWDYVRATNCTTYGNTFILIGHDGSLWYTTNTITVATLTPACQTGHWVGIHVYDYYGDWDQVYTFTY